MSTTSRYSPHDAHREPFRNAVYTIPQLRDPDEARVCARRVLVTPWKS